MTYEALAAGLREHLLSEFPDPIYAEALVAASDTHVVRSFSRRNGRKLLPISVDVLVGDAQSTQDFIGVIRHGITR